MLSIKKKKILEMSIVLIITFLLTYLIRFVSLISNSFLYFIINCLGMVLILSPSLFMYIKNGNSIKKLFNNIKLKNIIFAFIIFVGLQILFVVIPSFFNINLIGSAEKLSLIKIIKEAIYLIIFVGFIEEFIFRVYFQDLLIDLFDKNKSIGVIIQAFLFGFWHLINGNFIKVILTIIIGFIIGILKYKFEDCTYISTSLGHGFYDFMHVLTRMLFL